MPSIENDGEKIDAAELVKLFDRFCRADAGCAADGGFVLPMAQMFDVEYYRSRRRSSEGGSGCESRTVPPL